MQQQQVMPTFGYFGGGGPGPISTVNRIDYSNDTATASVRGPLSSIARDYHGQHRVPELTDSFQSVQQWFLMLQQSQGHLIQLTLDTLVVVILENQQ